MGKSPFKVIMGQRFGRLEVIGYVDRRWVCRCNCGTITRVLGANLLRGDSTSCGCKRRERSWRHGFAHTKQYNSWKQMIQRCDNPKATEYANYGGRGISVCDRWRDFAVFYADMGIRPRGYEIDRTDNDGNYEPGNCRWVPKRVNLRNRSTGHFVTWNGQTHAIVEWAEILGMKERTLHNRITRGMPPEEAFTRPVAAKTYAVSREKLHEAFGRAQTLTQWCNEYGIYRERVRGRLKMGWGLEKALLGSKGN